MSAGAVFDPARRSRAPELMESDAVDGEDYRACLADLSAVNTLTLGRRPVLSWLDRAFARLPPRVPVSILDVGYGYGDTLRAIHARRRGRRPPVVLSGIDLHPWSARAARAATPPDVEITYHVGDVFDHSPRAPVDFVVSSLFAHHLDDEDLVRFLAWMEGTARLGWFVNDLERSRFAYHGFRLLAGAMRWHRFVRHDGPVSIARAFRVADWERLLAQAGLSGAAEIRRRAPFRLCVERLK